MALRQLSALYLTAASAYTVAILLSHHPVLADRAGEAGVFVRAEGAQATAAIEARAVRPGWIFVRHEAEAITRNVMAAFVAPVVTARSRFAETPRAPRRLAANNAGQTHFAIKPKAVAAFHELQFATRVPESAPPPTDNSGLRLSEDATPPVSSAKNAPAPVNHTAPAASSQPNSGVAANPAHNPPAAAQRLAQTERPRLELAPQSEQSVSPPDGTPAEATAVPNLPPPTTAEIAQVEQRLKDSLTSEMYDNFSLFLYVSKAASGPWAQRMFVFEKEPTGDLALAYNWPVSTGREQIEYNSAGRKLPSFTPHGYYELDPHRFYSRYWSSQWGEPMPHAMFFNWQKDGEQTGLAIHGASGDNVAQLGQRASAGCIRLPPEAARTLFTLIKSKYRGLAPRFAIDHRTGTMSNDGILVHDSDGNLQLADGYKVLVFIEDFGGENVVAAMY